MPRKFSLVFVAMLLFPASISHSPTSFLFPLQYRKRCCDYFYHFHVAILVSVGVFVLFQCLWATLRIKEFFCPRSNEAKDKRGEILEFVVSFWDSDDFVSSDFYISTLHVPQVEKNWNAFCSSSMLIPIFFFYSFLGSVLGCINGTPLFRRYTKPKPIFTGRLYNSRTYYRRIGWGRML